MSVSAYVVCVCVHTCVFQGEVAKEAFPGKTVFELRPVESKREKGNGESFLSRMNLKRYIVQRN